MTENPFKHELLKQNGHSAVDQEVSRLHALIESERRRVRRLMWWTIGVWSFWFLMVPTALILPYVAAHANGPMPPVATQPATQAVAIHHASSPFATVIAGIFGVLLFAAFLGLPVAGVILAVMLIVSRRTASTNHIRASLAAIDTQLRMLGGTGVKSDKVE